MAKQKQVKRLQGKDIVTIILIVTIVVFSACCVGWHLIMGANVFGGEEINNNLLSSSSGNQPAVTVTAPIVTTPSVEKGVSDETDELGESEVVQISDSVVNILCVGLDESKSLTDVIMVVSLDTEKNTVSLLQIPRDSYVGTWKTGKINAAYTMGGGKQSIQNLIDEINEDFQLPVDHYMSIALDKFAATVDAVGGVEVNVPVTIPATTIYPEIPAGRQILGGKEAEWLVRQRHSYASADMGRQKMQRIFLAACMEKAKNLGIGEVVNAIPQVMGNFKTDMNTEELIKLAKLFIKVDMKNVRCFTLPGEGVWEKDEAYIDTNYYNYSVYSIHRQDTADLLNMYFRPYSSPVPAENLGIFEIVTPENYKVHYSLSSDGANFEDIFNNPSIK
jgi:LCP family protein required for cell wall assembly